MQVKAVTPQKMERETLVATLQALGYNECKLVTAVGRIEGADRQWHETLYGPSGFFSHISDDGEYVVLDGHNGPEVAFVVKLDDVLAVVAGLSYVRVEFVPDTTVAELTAAELEALPERERTAVYRLLEDIREGRIHEATSDNDLTPAQLADARGVA